MTSSSIPPEWTSLTHRLTEVPLLGRHESRSGRHRVLTAVTTAHASESPIVLAWVRARARGPLQVMVGGPRVTTGPIEVSVSFPAGARGRPLVASDVDGQMSALHWEPAQLAVDASSVVEEAITDRLEDLFAANPESMGFLAVARPVGAADVGELLEQLSDEIAQLEAHRAGRGVHRRDLARAEQNLEYFDTVVGIGGWQLELWTGAPTSAGASAVAAMLAASADVAEVAIMVRPSKTEVTSRVAWAPKAVVGSDVVAALVRPPFQELPGIRVTVRPQFDQNVEDTVQVKLGSVLDQSESPASPYGVSLKSLNRHLFVCGATGAGKSETVQSLLLALDRQHVPWLVIEPAKAEYAQIGPWLAPERPLVVIRPGAIAQPPPMINPLEPQLAGGRRRAAHLSLADPPGHGQGPVHSLVRGRGTLSSGAERWAYSYIPGGRLEPGHRRNVRPSTERTPVAGAWGLGSGVA